MIAPFFMFICEMIFVNDTFITNLKRETYILTNLEVFIDIMGVGDKNIFCV